MKNIEIAETEDVNDLEVLLVQSAIFDGSVPFSGCFVVFDIDLVTRTDPQTGKTFVHINCAFGDEPYNEESMIEIEVLSYESVVIGFDGEVIRRMRWMD